MTLDAVKGFLLAEAWKIINDDPEADEDEVLDMLDDVMTDVYGVWYKAWKETWKNDINTDSHS